MKKLLTFSPEQMEALQKAAIEQGFARQTDKRVYGVEAFLHECLAIIVPDYPASNRRRILKKGDGD